MEKKRAVETSVGVAWDHFEGDLALKMTELHRHINLVQENLAKNQDICAEMVAKRVDGVRMLAGRLKELTEKLDSQFAVVDAVGEYVGKVEKAVEEAEQKLVMLERRMDNPETWMEDIGSLRTEMGTSVSPVALLEESKLAFGKAENRFGCPATGER